MWGCSGEQKARGKMYGLVLESIQHYLMEQYGDDTWQEILNHAGQHNTVFTTHRQYSDQVMLRLAEACSLLLPGVFPTVDDSMHYFGTRFVEFGLVYGYDKILRVAGRHYRDFLHGIDNLHETIRFSYPRMQSPSFIVEEEDQEGCVLVYRSRRRGFAHYVMGQLQQCALQLYDVKVDVSVLQQSDTEHGCHVRYRLHFNNSAYCPPAMLGTLLTPAGKRFATVPGTLLFQLFPFCIVFNKDLIIQRVGLSAASFLGDRCQVGKSLTTVFVLRRPLVEFTWNNVVCLQGVVFELEAITEANSQTRRGKPLPQIHITSPTQSPYVQNNMVFPTLPSSSPAEMSSTTKSPSKGEITSNANSTSTSPTKSPSSREITSPAKSPGKVTFVTQSSPSSGEINPPEQLFPSYSREVTCSCQTSFSKVASASTTQSSDSYAEVAPPIYSLPMEIITSTQSSPTSVIPFTSSSTREIISPSQLPPLVENNISSAETPPEKDVNTAPHSSETGEVITSTPSPSMSTEAELCSPDRNLSSQARECSLAKDVTGFRQPISPTRDVVSPTQIDLLEKDSFPSPIHACYPSAYVTYPTSVSHGPYSTSPTLANLLERAEVDTSFPDNFDEDVLLPSAPVSPLGLYSSSSPTQTSAPENGGLDGWATSRPTFPVFPTSSAGFSAPTAEERRPEFISAVDADSNSSSPASRMMCPFAGLVASCLTQQPTTTSTTATVSSPTENDSSCSPPPPSTSSVVANATSAFSDSPLHASTLPSEAGDTGCSRTSVLGTGHQCFFTGQTVSAGHCPGVVNGNAVGDASPCTSSSCSSSSSSPSLSSGRTRQENHCRRTPHPTLPESQAQYHHEQKQQQQQQQQQPHQRGRSGSGRVGGDDRFLHASAKLVEAAGMNGELAASCSKVGEGRGRAVKVAEVRHAERSPAVPGSGKSWGISSGSGGAGGGGLGENNMRKKTCKKLLRGQMKLIPEWGQIAFLCTPLVSNLTELQQQGIYLNDLNMFDNSRDLVLQGHNHAPLLESLVEQQVDISNKIRENMKALDKERTQGNKLLYSMLPETIAVRLKQGHDPVNTCQTFDTVTILFSYLVGFKDICSNGGAMDVVRVINNSFAVFDPIVDKYSLYKVETLGDAVYMVAGGVPDKTDDHAQRVAYLALDFVAEAHRVKCPLENTSLSVRIGMHTGSIVAGIVGKRTPQYCLFGDTVNTAARLQSHSLPGRIHLSEPCHQCLKNTDLVSVYRGQVNVKGKGMLKTYWLAGRMGAGSTHSSMLLFHKERDQHLARQAKSSPVDGDLHALHVSSSSSFFMAADISTSDFTDMPKNIADNDDVFADILDNTEVDRKPGRSTTTVTAGNQLDTAGKARPV